jgi:hypothetical protein
LPQILDVTPAPIFLPQDAAGAYFSETHPFPKKGLPQIGRKLAKIVTAVQRHQQPKTPISAAI